MKYELTEESVEVPLVARDGDYDCIQTFLRPPLQTLEPGPIYLHGGLDAVHVAPHGLRSGGGEQSEGGGEGNNTSGDSDQSRVAVVAGNTYMWEVLLYSCQRKQDT